MPQGYRVNRLSNTLKEFYGRHTVPVGQYKKMSVKCLLIVPVKIISFSTFVKAELIKLAKMAGVMHEADHAYSTLALLCAAESHCFDL